jgi:hypothetical protein
MLFINKGGNPIRAKGWSNWPLWDEKAEKPMMDLLRNGNWYRGGGNKCEKFEEKYAQLISGENESIDHLVPVYGKYCKMQSTKSLRWSIEIGLNMFL